MSEDTAQFVEMFGCDAARIVEAGEKKFLILGWNCSTKDDAGQWLKDGEPYNFDYLKEQVVASGGNEEELLASAQEYKRLCGLTMFEYLRELTEGER